MKKGIAVLLALILGFTYCPSETAVMAAENEEKSVEIEEKKDDSLEQNEDKSVEGGENKEKNSESEEKITNDTEEGSFLISLLDNFFGGKEETLEETSEKRQKAVKKKSVVPESSGLKNLQIPQKLNVVIDPWEMDYRGQVYSEEYTIRNTGDTTGILTLSGLSCKPREQSGVVVRTDTEGIHDSGDKAIYMEMVLGNGEQIIFSQESSQYQTELKPGEELSIYFTGEVNENAFGQWENNDVAVSVVYSWKTEEELDAMAAEIPEEKQIEAAEGTEEIEEKTQENIDSKEGMNSDLISKELAERSEGDVEKEIPEEQQPEEDANESEAETTVDYLQKNSAENTAEEKLGAEKVNHDGADLAEANTSAVINEASISDNNLNDAEKEKDEIKNIVLQQSQKVDVVIDAWKIDEKGQIVSPQYLLENTGDTTGIWTLSELVCKPQEQSEVAVKTDKNELYNSEEKSVYMELVTGNGEKVVLSQENSQYKVELKPGEKLAVRFVGEMNGNLFENSEDGDIVVTAVCTWELE